MGKLSLLLVFRETTEAILLGKGSEYKEVTKLTFLNLLTEKSLQKQEKIYAFSKLCPKTKSNLEIQDL